MKKKTLISAVSAVLLMLLMLSGTALAAGPEELEQTNDAGLVQGYLVMVMEPGDPVPQRTLNWTDEKKSVLHWTSADPSVVTVDDDGRVTAVGVGVTELTAEMSDGSTEKLPVVVASEIGKPQAKTTEVFITELGKSQQLEVEALDGDSKPMPLIWTSSDPTAVTVDEKGVVTAVGDGGAVITAATEAGDSVEIIVVTGEYARAYLQSQYTQKLIRNVLVWGSIAVSTGIIVYYQFFWNK